MLDQRLNRLDLLQRWEAATGAVVVVLGTRPDAAVRMEECVRYVYEHFRELPQRPVERIDLVLIGRGLSAEVGARVATLLREYARQLRVIVTGAVGPGETVAALAADTLLMHPMATLTTALASTATNHATGLSGLVARMLSDENAAQPQYDAMLQNANAALVGDVLHRVEWVRDAIGQLTKGRLNAPSDDDVAALVDLLTRRVQRPGEPIDRRTAREFRALPVEIPKPDAELLMFDLHVAYEGGLDLLSPAPLGPRAVIESSHSLHTLDVVALEDGTERLHWMRHLETVVH